MNKRIHIFTGLTECKYQDREFTRSRNGEHWPWLTDTFSAREWSAARELFQRCDPRTGSEIASPSSSAVRWLRPMDQCRPRWGRSASIRSWWPSAARSDTACNRSTEIRKLLNRDADDDAAVVLHPMTPTSSDRVSALTSSPAKCKINVNDINSYLYNNRGGLALQTGPCLIRQIGPMSSGVTRKSGTLANNLSK